ncbi:MAG: HAD family hydrolase [Flavobacteriia bacterium]|nr:HAD family hydrolase [Flavobacteriia bacterium]
MRYKMLCTDLDGTLLALKNKPSEFTSQLFKKYATEISIVLVSARMPSGIRYIQEILGVTNQPIICYNGALVMNGEQVISSHTIPVKLIKDVANLCQNHQVALGLYSYDEWFAPAPSERVAKEEFNTQTKVVFEPTLTTLDRWQQEDKGAHKLMLMGTKQGADQLQELLDTEFKKEMDIYRSNDTLIEISPAGIDKLTGIKALTQPGISLSDIMAFGDNYNDISMLQGVGLGVAMENGRQEVKDIADQQAKSCAADGVAHFLEHYINTYK